MKMSVNEWRDLCITYMLECGMPQSDAEAVVDAALCGDMRGVSSHGTSRLPIYRNRINVGVVNREPKPHIENDGTAFLRVNGDNGLGQIATLYALEQCAERARKFGIAGAVIHNSNHIGMLAYYAMKACEKKLVSFVTCHTVVFAAAPGGKQPIVGTNPHCWGFPCAEGPIILDMAITIARGKVKDALVAGKDIPLGWAVDKYGKDTTSAKDALEGLLLPVGGVKGYGLGVVSTLLSGVMSGAPFRDDMAHSLDNLKTPADAGAFVLLIDPEKVIGYEDYIRRTSQFHAYVKNSEKWDPEGEVFLPGEIEYRRYLASAEDGLDIDTKTYDIITGKEAFVPVF